MHTLTQSSCFNIFTLAERLNAFAEDGIDPAFDAEYEELEREYAELRLTFTNY